MAKSKTWLTKGGFVREDSDDELGYDDHPWEWTYAVGGSNDDGASTEHVSSPAAGADEANDKERSGLTASSRKRKRSAVSNASTAGAAFKRRIVGARMGTFSVRVGDAVLLKSPEAGKDWAGLICAFSAVNEDDEAEMCAHIMWFCSREELELTGAGGSNNSKNVRKLPDAMMNESYITADFNMNPLTAINGRAHVMGYQDYLKMYPNGEMPKGKAAAARWSKTIMCRRGVKQRNLRFTEEIEWPDIYTGPEDLLGLLDWVKGQTKGARRKTEDTDYNQKMAVSATLDEEEGDEDMDMGGPRTPKKKRKTTTSSTATTPKSSVKSAKFSTPASGRRIMIKKAIEITPLGTRFISPAVSAVHSPYSQARTTLHVSHVPVTLPCRGNEFEMVYSHLHSAITDGTGSCIYISGTPGTGKTATVREVVSHLLGAVQNDELDDFNFVEINGMKVTEPAQSYSLLWEALKGDRVSASSALSLLEHEFSHPSPRRIPCVVLMDELDQLVTKSQSVMYNFFNWPSLRHSRLIVLAVANTMDLPERTLSNKISSRLGLVRITFPGYTHAQLMEIITSRLESAGAPGHKGGLVDKDAVQFAARKVAAVSGDARRALDICRRAVEIAEQQAKEIRRTSGLDEDDIDMDVTNTPSKTGRGRMIEDDGDKTPKAHRGPSAAVAGQPRVTIATIKAAINEATSNPIVQHLRSLPLSSKLFLAALLARSRRTGLGEAALGDVLGEAKRIADVDERDVVHDFLLRRKTNDYADAEGAKHSHETPRVLAMGAAAMELVEAGIISMDPRSRGERAGKVRLRIGEEVVVSALMGDDEAKGMGFTS